MAGKDRLRISIQGPFEGKYKWPLKPGKWFDRFGVNKRTLLIKGNSQQFCKRPLCKSIIEVLL
jgi:hypothetical protein